MKIMKQIEKNGQSKQRILMKIIYSLDEAIRT